MWYDWINREFNNHLNDIRNWRDHDRNFMSREKAKHVMSLQEAEEWLTIIDQLENFSNHNRELESMLTDRDNQISKDKKVLDEYIKTFWMYKVDNKTAWGRDDEIVMPETNSYKLYKKIFNEEDYPYSEVKSWNKVNLTIEVLDDSYKILSRKVTKIIPKDKKDEK